MTSGRHRYLDDVAARVYPQRVAFENATSKWEADIASYNAGGADSDADMVAGIPEKPVEPVYEDFDTLIWWRETSPRYKYLSVVARNLLCIMPSSAEVERLFSKGGLVLTSRRNSIGDDKEEKFMMAAYNAASAWKEKNKLGKADAEAAHAAMLSCFYDGCVEGADADE